jgi:multidrug efflux pump subunit AcrA (membrane-fusion protein)
VAPDSQQSFFLPGAKVRADILANRLTQVLTVPLQAVFSDEQGQYVWKQQGTSLTRQDVSLGAKSLTHAEITAGLKAGDRISLLAPEN